jgi:hypothetical protein
MTVMTFSSWAVYLFASYLIAEGRPNLSPEYHRHSHKTKEPLEVEFTSSSRRSRLEPKDGSFLTNFLGLAFLRYYWTCTCGHIPCVSMAIISTSTSTLDKLEMTESRPQFDQNHHSIKVVQYFPESNFEC